MTNIRDAKDVQKFVKDKNVSFIQFWFTDVLGKLKSFSVTPSELEEGMAEGMGFDGSSIEGFARIEESDMIALPDPKTFQLIPWRPSDRPVARMFCDILNPDGTPYMGDPRYALKRILAKIANQGQTYYVGPELEYFYFANDSEAEILDQAGYFDGLPTDRGTDLRRQTIFALQSMGIRVEYSHHEVAPSQHEIDLRYLDALTMSDAVMTYRVAVKEIARQNGVYATFMPKPIFGQNGSGMHVHQSLFKGSKNTFFDAKDRYHLSKTARSYVAGLLKHAPSITSVTSQWVNSYKRLVPGYEAPVYLSWARRNRSDLIRVPEYQPGKEKPTRIEYRSPDPAWNPYLTFRVILAGGLDGIKNKIELPAPVEQNVYEMTEKEREERGIHTLPGSLWEAVELARNSKIVREALGEHVFNAFLENKKIEWDKYRTQVTDYEIKRYLPVL